jgi:hypothetical protein
VKGAWEREERERLAEKARKEQVLEKIEADKRRRAAKGRVQPEASRFTSNAETLGSQNTSSL